MFVSLNIPPINCAGRGSIIFTLAYLEWCYISHRIEISAVNFCSYHQNCFQYRPQGEAGVMKDHPIPPLVHPADILTKLRLGWAVPHAVDSRQIPFHSVPTAEGRLP